MMPHPLGARTLLAVSMGGMLGAVLRVGLLMPAEAPTPTGAPLTVHTITLWAINVVGSALLGGLTAFLLCRVPAHPLVRPFWGVGVLGGFTSFSAVAALATTHEAKAVVAHHAAHSVGGIVAAAAGYAAITAWRQRHPRAPMNRSADV